MSLCDVCERFKCKVCGHEACPVCQTFCDDYDCIIWNKETGKGRDGHMCVFEPCPNGCVRKYGDDD